MTTITGLRKLTAPTIRERERWNADNMSSGRDDFNREYNYNSGSFSINDKNELHVSQDSPEDGEEDDEDYDSNEEEVCRS